MKNKRIKYADLFAGCGGLSYGFKKRSEFEHILATDVWRQAQITYHNNFNNLKYVLADLTKKEDIEKIVAHIGSGLDILMGGPPCQGFSTLNNAKGHSKHNTLVDQYLTIVEKTTPNMFLMENVRGFKSKRHPSGLTYSEHVKNRISDIRPLYRVIDFTLNTRDYGLAQNRVRYFLLATKRSYDPKGAILEEFQLELNRRACKTFMTLRAAIGDLPKVGVREGADKIELDDGSIIYNHKSMNHGAKLEVRFSHVPPGGGLLDVPFELLTSHLKRIVNGDYGSGGFAKNIYGRMDWNKPSGTIVAGMDKITVGRFLHPEENRLLTPRECARIQSFPDNFVFSGGMVSQYYQIGNAVPPKVSDIFAEILSQVIPLCND